jgi:steroid 5-alpha reductase family enzyme
VAALVGVRRAGGGWSGLVDCGGRSIRPPTEAQALRSRGDAYREYQRTTNAFFPWPPMQESRR